MTKKSYKLDDEPPKSSVNWQIPTPIAKQLDEVVTKKFGGNAKWVGLCAAVMMYLDADAGSVATYERLATSMQVPGEAEEWVDKNTYPRVAAKRMTGPKPGKRINKKPPTKAD